MKDMEPRKDLVVAAAVEPVYAQVLVGLEKAGPSNPLESAHRQLCGDLVICCNGSGAKALKAMREMMRELKLTVNEEKTRLGPIPTDTFAFRVHVRSLLLC
jgi:hypothetical protein